MVLFSASPAAELNMENKMNVVVLRGTLTGEPIERTLASGVTVTNWDVESEQSGVVHKVPVQWEDADRRVQAFDQGDAVVVLGVVRRRFFQTGGATAARTEVVGQTAAKPTQKVAVAKLFDQARSLLS